MSATDHTRDPMGDRYSELLRLADACPMPDGIPRWYTRPEVALPLINPSDQAFIIACSPGVVRGLASELRDAEAREAAAEVASRGYRERAEKAEAKAARFAGLLGHQSRTLTDAIAAETIRQKADAWEEEPWCPTHPDVDYIRAECDAARAERDALAAQVERVRALHSPIKWAPTEAICDTCSVLAIPDVVDFPCDTLRALDGDGGE